MPAPCPPRLSPCLLESCHRVETWDLHRLRNKVELCPFFTLVHADTLTYHFLTSKANQTKPQNHQSLHQSILNTFLSLCICWAAVHCVGLSTGRADSHTTDIHSFFNTGRRTRMPRTQEATERASLPSTLSETHSLVTFSFITPTLNHKATSFP